MSEETLPTAKRRFHIEEGILILLLILSLVGIGINDFSPADGLGYWLVMVAVFGLFALVLGWLQSKHRTEDFRLILKEQSIHWAICLLVVGAGFLVQKSDRLDAENEGWVILLILSLATMLDGLRVGWRFGLVGLFLGASAVVAAYLQHFFWIEIAIAFAIVLATFLWEYIAYKREQA